VARTFAQERQPIQIGHRTIRSRVMPTGQGTRCGMDGLPADRRVSYRAEPARGGIGLIITQATGPAGPLAAPPGPLTT